MYHLFMSDSVVSQFFQVLPVSLLVCFIYAFWQYKKYKGMQLPGGWSMLIIRSLFACYLTGLVNLVLTPLNFWNHIWFYIFNGYDGCPIGPMFVFSFNLIPTVFKYIANHHAIGSWIRTMLIGNVLMFIPMGVFLPFASRKFEKRQGVCYAFLIPLAIESLQPIVGRSFDVDDLICNTLGIAAGYLVAFSIKHLLKK